MQHQDLPGLTAAYDYWYNCDHYDDNMMQTLSHTHLDAQTHSRQSSGNSETSPISATFSARTHRSESSSSLASSPPSFDSDGWIVTSRKSNPGLPDVAEESQEREDTPQQALSTSSYTSAAASPKVGSRRGSGDLRIASFFNATPIKYDDAEYSAAASNEHLYMSGPQRADVPTIKEGNRKIAASIPGPIRAGLSRTLSLLSRSGTKKRSSTISSPTEPKPSTPKVLSRASSYRRSTMSQSHDASFSSLDLHPASAQIDTIVEDGDLMSSPMEIADSSATSYFDVQQQNDVIIEDPIVRSKTPLLPPVMDNMKEEEPIQSPLISPSVAPVTNMMPTSFTGELSPQLSAQASTTSFGRSRAGTVMSSSSELDLNDSAAMREINEKLGHSNFTIYPSPYIPEACDLIAVNTLRAFHAQAITGWATVQEDNAMHMVKGSELCNLLQAKWALIDAEWKRCIEETTRRGHGTGQLPMQMTPLELVPDMSTPKAFDHKATNSDGAIDTQVTNISDPKICIGVGVEEILGPMAQDAPQVQPKPSLMRRLTTRAARAVSSTNLSGLRSPPRSQSP